MRNLTLADHHIFCKGCGHMVSVRYYHDGKNVTRHPCWHYLLYFAQFYKDKKGFNEKFTKYIHQFLALKSEFDSEFSRVKAVLFIVRMKITDSDYAVVPCSNIDEFNAHGKSLYKVILKYDHHELPLVVYASKIKNGAMNKTGKFRYQTGQCVYFDRENWSSNPKKERYYTSLTNLNIDYTGQSGLEECQNVVSTIC